MSRQAFCADCCLRLTWTTGRPRDPNSLNLHVSKCLNCIGASKTSLSPKPSIGSRFLRAELITPKLHSKHFKTHRASWSPGPQKASAPDSQTSPPDDLTGDSFVLNCQREERCHRPIWQASRRIAWKQQVKQSYKEQRHDFSNPHSLTRKSIEQNTQNTFWRDIPDLH